jgi:hypothetical protein
LLRLSRICLASQKFASPFQEFASPFKARKTEKEM